MNGLTVIALSPTALRLGFESALRRVAQFRKWWAFGFSAAFAVTFAALERNQAVSGAADRALLGASFLVTMPIVAYAAAEIVFDARRADAVLQPLARHGANRRLAL